MSFLFLVILYALALGGFALALFLALEVAAAMVGGDETSGETIEAGPVTVVVPAHNEAASIAPTLENIRAQLRANDRMLVVADNCSDRTAEVARAHGADVIERNDLARRGKGYALQFALDHLRAAPPEIVVFTDADCVFTPGALQRVAGAAARDGRPAQALYLMKAPEGSGPRLQVAEFAWAFINNARMRGLARLFDVTRFTGAGFAAPWRALAGLDLASGEIVEDLALTMTLIRKGAAPLFVPDALVTSEFPTDDAALTRQSARWSIGSLAYGPRASATALVEGVAKGRFTQIGAAIDLMIPPLTVFVALLLGVAGLCLIAWMLTGVSGAFELALWALIFAGGAIVAAWFRFGRDALPPSALRGVIEFLASKLSVFGARGRESAKTWTPTRGGSNEQNEGGE
ncbi:glycosyltransferase family 2 protein [Hyphococcus sp.]|uniref:glycosyltransferase family 2 protein n=1 Tax=Hyphococcus sp. TaxID=2038636 RepID=UPI003D1484DC